MSGNSFGAADGDWICPSSKCGNLNFARRTACNRCGADRPKEIANKKKFGIEIGKAAAEKSKGLFSADDWQCGKCGNVNWARRSTCNMCNAPKVGEVEERTGFGGGYNEREGVEYIQREESDDEFDEFGRRKKKFRNLSGNVNSKGSSSKETLEEKKSGGDDGEEEEEEDDEDEGDLSKYDLSGWGEEGDAPAPDRAPSASSSTSSSSSSSSGSRSSSRSPSRSPAGRSRRRRPSSSSSRSRSRSRSRSSSRSRSRSGSGRRGRHGSSSKTRSRSPVRRR